MREYVAHLQTLSQKQLVLALARQRAAETQGAAVVGIGCRLPGGLDGPAAFWEVLRSGRNVLPASGRVPRDSTGRPRWNLTDGDFSDWAQELSYGGYLEGVDLFDAERFGISAEEAVQLDPQQRLLLTVADEALADAGMDRAQRAGHRVGVWTTVGTVEYHHAALRGGAAPASVSPYAALGSAPSGGAARVAHGLGLDGPALTVDTACSSTLVAVQLALAALRRDECDVAVVGAANLLLSPLSTVACARAGMLSPTGRSRPLTAHADGHVRAEGCGVVVLCRQSDAARFSATPYAVLRGGAVHQHGSRADIATPSAEGQRHTMAMALRNADVRAEEVQYVEAHANGSRLGGLIETEALAAAYRGGDLLVGSHKANIGYLEAASGAAGLIKVALALAHREIPAHPGAAEPEPEAPWSDTLRLPRETVPWPTAARMLAGVSAVGFSGTQAHVLLEAAPTPRTAEDRPAPRRTDVRSYWAEQNRWT
uniref:Polyketide synthase n=1 Tax=Streptomyces sp. NBC_00003 TaxID=2903608 RepID=A0AAU2V557_9ACTN